MVRKSSTSNCLELTKRPSTSWTKPSGRRRRPLFVWPSPCSFALAEGRRRRHLVNHAGPFWLTEPCCEASSKRSSDVGSLRSSCCGGGTCPTGTGGPSGSLRGVRLLAWLLLISDRSSDPWYRRGQLWRSWITAARTGRARRRPAQHPAAVYRCRRRSSPCSRACGWPRLTFRCSSRFAVPEQGCRQCDDLRVTAAPDDIPCLCSARA